MRQIFTSARLETVEGVARLLEDQQIATRIRNGRSYKGSYSRGFSYRDAPSANQPAVWVVHPDDYARARQLLREAGLIEPGPQHSGNFASSSYTQATAQSAPPKANTPARLRAGLLIGIAAILLMSAFWQQQQKPGMPNTTTRRLPLPTVPTQTAEPPAIYTVETPPMLARTLAAQIATAHGIKSACLLRDGEVMPDEAGKTPACNDANRIHIHDYRTDGSGRGEVAATWQEGGKEQHGRYRVQREGHDWQVLE